jgi:hypothetical protein
MTRQRSPHVFRVCGSCSGFASDVHVAQAIRAVVEEERLHVQLFEGYISGMADSSLCVQDSALTTIAQART